MINLLKIPNSISKRVLEKETISYMEEHKDEFSIPPDRLIEFDRGLPGMDYYHIYKNNIKIGFITGFVQDEYWVANRVWLEGRKKIYFQQVIDAIKRLKQQQGFTGIIAHPDQYTASIYKKHNILKEI